MSHDLAAISMQTLAASKLSGSALRVWCAVNVLQTEGQPLTVQRIMRVTGLSRSQVFQARKQLHAVRETGFRESRNMPSDQELDDEEGSEIANTGLELERAVVHSIVHREGTNGSAPPAWQQAVTTVAAGVDITKSRDLFHEVFAPAYDTVATEVNECIALAASYVETATGDTLDAADRKKVALLVRSYGKAGVFGIHQALGVTEDSTNMLKYARKVAERVVKEHRPGP